MYSIFVDTSTFGALDNKARADDTLEEITSNNKVKADATTVADEQKEDNDADSSISADAAIKFVLDRKQAYEAQNRSYVWPLRGIGYLYENHGVVLAGQYVSAPDIVATRKKHSIHIFNVLKNKVSCSDLVIWIQIIGPTEIFSGQARAHSNEDECHWEYDFDARASGSYNIEAKLMEWKPDVPRPVKCPVVTTDASIVESYPVRKSFLGFKMYKPTEMCCEICSRLAGHCKAWATPIPAFPMGLLEGFKNRHHKVCRGCELFFDNETSLGVVPYSPMISQLNKTNETQFHLPADQVAQAPKKVYGLPHHYETMQFLGCGWSYWFTVDFQCLSGALDDKVFFANNLVNLTNTDLTVDSIDDEAVHAVASTKEEPLCSIESERFGTHSGRWVVEPWPSEQECPVPHSKDPTIFLKQHTYQGDNPKCWRRDDLSIYNHDCVEINCELIETSSKWESPLYKEKQWCGDWKHDSGCSYTQYTESELQQCVDRRKLYGFKVDGASVAAMINAHFSERMENINFYNNTEFGDGTKVTISTFRLLHYSNFPNTVKDYFENKAPNVTKDEEFFWVSGYFLSSEREIQATASRMKQYSVWGEKYLTLKGYKMINAHDMTAAFTYDTAWQDDGMHISGPPVKMILTKVLHYLCSEK